MKSRSSRFGALIIAALSIALQTTAADRAPNIILIFADDQGWGDLGCYGSPNIETPNIDRLAAEGIRFTSFYAAPFCGPSRAQLMTGCYHARVSHSFNPGPKSPRGLNPDEITIAELLKTVGYATMHIGKWHLGDHGPLLPTRQGFDQFFGLPFSNDMWHYHPKMPVQDNEGPLVSMIRQRAAYTGFAGQGSYYDLSRGQGFPNPLPLMRDESVIENDPDQTQLTTRYTEEALNFINTHKDRPFFLYLAHAMPHVPLFVSDKFRGKSNRGLYGDVMMEIDWSCGQIVKKLQDLKLTEKTIIIYTSDNGPWLGYGIDGGSAGPFREGKGTIREGGMRVPAIFHYPGKIPPGQRSHAMAGTMDIFPTLAGLAGVPVPNDRIIDGQNLWPLLNGKTSQSPHTHFHYFAGARPDRIANYRAIRDQRWKLTVRRTTTGSLEPVELYDLASDPSERFDRLAQHPEISKPLLEEATRFSKELEANRRPHGTTSQ